MLIFFLTLWSHAVLHAKVILKLRPTLLHTQSPLELNSSRTPHIAHLRTFGCEIWVPFSDSKQHTMTPHKIGGIYLGYTSPIIICYKLPQSDDIYNARFQHCRFIENNSPNSQTKTDQSLNFKDLEMLALNPNPCTTLADSEVNKLLHLQHLAKNISQWFPLGTTHNWEPRTRFWQPCSSSSNQETKAQCHPANPIPCLMHTHCNPDDQHS